MRAYVEAGSVLLVAATMLGCPGELEDPARFLTATTCPNIEGDLLLNRCATTAGCHSAADMLGELDLESSGVGSRLSGQPGSSACSGTILADPDNPLDSLLYTKLTDNPPCGSQMPFGGGEKLDQTELDCVRDYISGLPTGGPGAGGGPGSGGGGSSAGGMSAGGAGGNGGTGG